MYWLTTVRGDGTPHARPIWGVWLDGRLLLSVGSWEHWRAVKQEPRVSVHLDSSLEVVIVEGIARPEKDRNLIRRWVDIYNAKYDWDFDADTLHAPPVNVQPEVAFGWTTKGEAAREGFASTGKWTFA
jgi:hypothetical protein